MRLAVTGHRPDKLGGYDADSHRTLIRFAVASLQRIAPKEVVTGMAIGWDQAIAEAALLLNIPFVAAVPFSGQESKWPQAVQSRYRELYLAANEIQTVCYGGYAPWKMQERNCWMVDNSDELLALWNGTAGGTANCVGYAQKKGKKITNVWPEWQSFVSQDDRWDQV